MILFHSSLLIASQFLHLELIVVIFIYQNIISCTDVFKLLRKTLFIILVIFHSLKVLQMHPNHCTLTLAFPWSLEAGKKVVYTILLPIAAFSPTPWLAQLVVIWSLVWF